MKKRLSFKHIGAILRQRRLFYLYLGCMLVCAFTIALMPVASLLAEEKRVFLILDGMFFWLGIAGALASCVLINRKRKGSMAFTGRYPKLKRLGLIHFFQNRAALIADIAMFVLTAGIVIVRIITDNVFILFPLLAGIVFAFGMHCMLNGINYIYLFDLQSIGRN